MADIEKLLGEGSKFLSEGEYPKAVKKFKEAVAEDPDLAVGYFYSAEALRLDQTMGNTRVKDKDILENYAKSVELDDANPEYMTSYGSFLMESEAPDFDKAEDTYKKAFELAAEDAEFSQMLASEYMFNIRTNADRALTRKQANQYIIRGLGYLFAAMGLEKERATGLLLLERASEPEWVLGIALRALQIKKERAIEILNGMD